MATVALITCRELPEPDPDQAILLSALHHAGIHAELLAWDDPQAHPEAFDLCILRSCWNYYEHPSAFLAWIETTASCSRLLNSASVVRWNLHKRYLQRLQDTHVPIIPTIWLAQGAPSALHTIMRTRGWHEVVIKPAVSAGSFRTQRFRADHVQEGQRFLSTLLHERDMLVQRYMPAVEQTGEKAVVWIDGACTHAVRKRLRFAGGVEHVSDALDVLDHERAIADLALSCVGDEVLYARVDVMQDDDGTLVVSELELIEPSLFLLEASR